VPALRLPAHLENSVLAGHPWIYRDQLPAGWPPPRDSSWVELHAGKVRAFALWDAESPLALRIYSREQAPDATWCAARVEAACELRALWRDPLRTDAFRLINGEGDQLPGIVVDVYAGYAVISLASTACELLIPWLIPALNKALTPAGILLKNSARKPAAGASATPNAPRLSVLSGRAPEDELIVKENGLLLRANLFTGQKTGLFLDQRDNRSLIERVSRGRRVLNLCSYTGAFSLYALRGGASEVVSVDSSGPAMSDAQENFRLNGFALEPHGFEVRDVFEYLEDCRLSRRRFDLVICDPPSFGSQQAHTERAINAYTRLFAAGLKVVAPGGLFAASSCTARVTPKDLTYALAQAAKKARQQVQIIADNGHAPDHPICAGHAEGRYLKFLLGRVTPRA
jgi:23S rRNA (cytosine1962-C5)-methyltransferase